MKSLNNPYKVLEPSISKAKFILPNQRIYTLDFDHNITMEELKLMIQKAAHLRRNSFKLFSNGEEYSQFNEETFDSLFPNQNNVEFTLELEKGEENYDETELLIQMNSPCPHHVDKFLLYFCYTCNTSICSDCFTVGSHKNHQIQDKCFYLLSSKYLVDKIFQNWSNKPYEDYQISVDLTQLKTEINNIMFDKLFQMLQKIKEKCILIVDEYNKVNINSLGNIRDSVRDIKVSCIKALDNLKEDLNIKDIVNNQQIFIEFDKAYKDLGKLQNEKFQQNLVIFQELNKKVSLSVSDLIKRIYNLIYKTLDDCLNEQQFNSIKNEINKKLIKPADKNEIMSQMSEYQIKRNSAYNFNPKSSVSSIDSAFRGKTNSDQGKNFSSIQTNINANQVNPFVQKDNNSFLNQNQNKSMINENVNTKKVNFGYNGNSVSQTAHNYFPLEGTVKFGSTDNNVGTTIGQKKEENKKQMNIFSNNINKTEVQNIDSNLNSNYGTHDKLNLGKIGPFSSAQTNRQVISNNQIPKNNINTSNLFTASTNREIHSFGNIGDSSSNLMVNSNQNKNNPFNFGNMNNNINNKIITTTTTTKIIPNQINQQTYHTIETKKTTTTTETFVPSNLTNNMVDSIANTITNIVNKGNVNQNTLMNYTNNTGLNNFENYMNKEKLIIEEMTESESEIRRPTDVRKFLKTQYILFPIPQTSSIKILTIDSADEKTVPLKFPENFGFNFFLLDCAYCNCSKNKCLYVSGGIESNLEQKRSNVLLCVDITKPDEFKITKKASMNYPKCGHTMISDDKYIYSVGGEDLDIVERYDIENDVWETLPHMISKRMYPILYIYNGYLYAFFGKYSNGQYPCTIERLNISENSGIQKPSWELIVFANENNIDLRYYGCALHESEGLLFFFGGKCNEQTSNKIFYYNFEYRFIELEESKTIWKEYFKENLLHKIGERFVQCSETRNFGVYLNLTEQ